MRCNTILMMMVMLATSASWAGAQQPPRIEVFAGFSEVLAKRLTNEDFNTVRGLTPAQVQQVFGFDVSSNRGRTALPAAHAALAVSLDERWAVVADVSGGGRSETQTFFAMPTDTRLRGYQVLGGTRLRLPRAKRLAPSLHALAGVAHSSNRYTNALGTVTDKVTAPAIALGASFDLHLQSRVALRLLQIDYNPMFADDRRVTDTTATEYDLAGRRRDNVRLSFGLTLLR